MKTKFIELKSRSGYNFLFDVDSGWEIHDKGQGVPAFWTNYKQSHTLECENTYEQIRTMLLGRT